MEKKVVIVCGRCNKTYRFPVIIHDEDCDLGTGMVNILIDPPCKHKMLLYMDSKGSIRSAIQIEKVVSNLEPIELKGIDDKILQLEKKHEELMKNKDYNAAFYINKQIVKLKKEKRGLELEISSNLRGA